MLGNVGVADALVEVDVVEAVPVVASVEEALTVTVTEPTEVPEVVRAVLVVGVNFKLVSFK